MSAARRVSALPTANGGIARAAYASATDAGLDLKPLLHSAGLSLKQIRTSDVRISVRSQVKFLNSVADALEDDFLGVRIAQSIELRELGLLYYVMASSENLANALARLARYSGIQNEGVHLAFSQHRHVAMSFEHSGFSRADDRHQVECFMDCPLAATWMHFPPGGSRQFFADKHPMNMGSGSPCFHGPQRGPARLLSNSRNVVKAGRST